MGGDMISALKNLGLVFSYFAACFFMPLNAASISGTVFQKCGNNPAPAPNATVSWAGDQSGEVTTNNQGKFLIDNLEPNTVFLLSVQFGSFDFAPSYHASGESNVVFCPSLAPKEISGTVFQKCGNNPEPAPKATVFWSKTDDPHVFSNKVIANNQGQFTISGLVPGASYFLQAAFPDHAYPASVAFAGSSSEELCPQIDISSRNRTLVGKVKDNMGNPAAGVPIIVFSRNVQVGAGVTDSNGKYRIAGLPHPALIASALNDDIPVESKKVKKSKSKKSRVNFKL